MKQLLFTLLVFALFSAQAQEDEKQGKVWRAALLLPKIGVEMPLTETVTFFPAVGLRFQPIERVAIPQFYPAPYLQLDFRAYYNLNARKRKEKNTADFSADFISIKNRPLFVLNTNENGNVSTPIFGYHSAVVWGLQRSIGKAGYFCLMLGPGFTVTGNNYTSVSLLGGSALELGFRFH